MIRFVDATVESGIDFVHIGGRSEELYEVESIGSGVAVLDFDGDGAPDLFFANGGRVAPTGDGAPPARDRLYRNDGSGRFLDATIGSGLDDPRYALGACAADFDNDGDPDLFVTHFDAPDALYRNEGGGRFVDVAAVAGVAGGGDTDGGAAFADIDGDGWLDLCVAVYAAHGKEQNLRCLRKGRNGKEVEYYCEPRRYPAVADRLYRNRGDGTFADVSVESGIAAEPRHTFQPCFADFDDDGDADLLLTCDTDPNLLWINDGRGRFAEAGLGSGIALSAIGRTKAGMGVAVADWSGDERLDAAITYFVRESDSLYRNEGANHFDAVEEEAGVADETRHTMGWGTAFLDADLDGDLDWLTVNGEFRHNWEEFYSPGIGYAQPRRLFQNRGDGTFASLREAAGPAFERVAVGRGLALLDADLDGDLDAVTNDLDGPARLLRNDSPREGRRWLAIDLEGRRSNRDAIGARVTLELDDGRRLVREVSCGGSFLSSHERALHFGLGSAAVVRATVRWPSGACIELGALAGDQRIRWVEPQLERATELPEPPPAAQPTKSGGPSGK